MNNVKTIESFKVVLVGESGVGKTSIITQFIEQQFNEDPQSTTCGAFSRKSVICDETKEIKFEIWDTAGQERYRSLTRMYYKDANAAILVYDITRKESYEQVKSYWYEEIKENSSPNIILVIAGNKADLIANEEVDEDESREFAKSIRAKFIRCSAKNVLGIEDIFIDVAKQYTGCENVKIKPDTNDDVQIQENKDTYKITNDKSGKGSHKKGCC